MSVFRIQNSLQDRDGLSRDRYVNTFYWGSITPVVDQVATCTQLNALVAAYYNGISVFLSGQVQTGGHTVKAYDMLLPPNTRDPIAPLTYGVPTGTNGALPEEVALAITLEAAPREGVQPQSTRGRVFIGPCAAVDLAPELGNSGSRPSASFRSTCLSQMDVLIEGFAAVKSDGFMGIASTVQGKVKLADGSRHLYEVIACSVDDAWDTQRSRGKRPTLRTREVNKAGPGVDMTW